jgi:hypothetical protein
VGKKINKLDKIIYGFLLDMQVNKVSIEMTFKKIMDFLGRNKIG